MSTDTTPTEAQRVAALQQQAAADYARAQAAQAAARDQHGVNLCAHRVVRAAAPEVGET